MDFYLNLLELNKSKKEVLFYHSFPYIGLGSMISRIMVGLNLSVVNNFDFSYDTNDQYCIDKYFEPKFKKEKTGYTKIIQWDFMKDSWESPTRNQQIYPMCPLEPWTFLSKDQWNAILAYCVCGSPTPQLELLNQEFKMRVNWNSYDIHIGMHIRCGDKTDQNPYIPIEIYILYLNLLVNLPIHKDKSIAVYLTSDDESVYHKVKQELLNKNLSSIDILWDEKELRYNNCNGAMVRDNPVLLDQETATGCKCISLLGDCKYVIGMSSSQFTWLGGLVSAFKQNLNTHNILMIDPFTYQLGHWGKVFM